MYKPKSSACARGNGREKDRKIFKARHLSNS